jgi:hypothetical protein
MTNLFNLPTDELIRRRAKALQLTLSSRLLSHEKHRNSGLTALGRFLGRCVAPLRQGFPRWNL